MIRTASHGSIAQTTIAVPAPKDNILDAWTQVHGVPPALVETATNEVSAQSFPPRSFSMRIPSLLHSTALCLMLGLSGTAQAADPAAAIAEVGKHVMSLGPNGEKPEPASSVSLSADELAKIKGMHAKAAIVMHYAGNDWSQAQIEGLKAQFAAMGIDCGGCDGCRVQARQTGRPTSRPCWPRNPTSSFRSRPIPVATATEYKAAADAGVKLVFMDNVPKGFMAGKDYVSVVSADNYGNGVATAHLLAQALGGKGDVGLDLPRR